MDYLVMTISDEQLHLEMKSFPAEVSGENMWNLHKEKDPMEIVRIPEEVKENDPQVTGTLSIINKTGTKTLFKQSGCFKQVSITCLSLPLLPQ